MINTLLLGKPGLSMLNDALDMAAKLLNTEYTETHPDYLYVDLPENKKVIGVDNILPVVEKGCKKPVLAEHAVAVINHMDCLTDAAQNKLLLTLESNCFLCVIGVAYRDTLLSTVKSRMKILEYRPISKKDFITLYKDFSKKDSLLLYHATGGCPGLVPSLSDNIGMFHELYDICQGKNPHRIMDVLHLVKEKDPLAVHNDKQLLLAVIHVLEYAMVERAFGVLSSDATAATGIVCAINRLLEDESLCQTSCYTKDNFFRTIAFLTEI